MDVRARARAANISCNRLKLTSDSFAGPTPNTVADTWMDSFQVGSIQKLRPCGKLLAVAGELNRLSGGVCCLRGRGGAGAERERRCSCRKKGLFKKSEEHRRETHNPFFISPPFLIWHTRLSLLFFSPSVLFLFLLPFFSPSFCSVLLFFFCGKFNGFLGSE